MSRNGCHGQRFRPDLLGVVDGRLQEMSLDGRGTGGKCPSDSTSSRGAGTLVHPPRMTGIIGRRSTAAGTSTCSGCGGGSTSTTPPSTVAWALWSPSWAIVLPIGEIGVAFASRRRGSSGWGWTLAAGILNVVFGVLLPIWPVSGVLTLSWIVGVFALAGGVALIILALRCAQSRDPPCTFSAPADPRGGRAGHHAHPRPVLRLHDIPATVVRYRPEPYDGTHVLPHVEDARAGREFGCRLTPHVDSPSGGGRARARGPVYRPGCFTGASRCLKLRPWTPGSVGRGSTRTWRSADRCHPSLFAIPLRSRSSIHRSTICWRRSSKLWEKKRRESPRTEDAGRPSAARTRSHSAW
jgi:hypothetical protein